MGKKIYLFSISSHPEAIHINSLDIKFLKPKIDFLNYDYLIITSKQASEALKQYDKSLFIDKKALAISIQSAKSFEQLGGEILDIGAGYGDTLIDKIKNYPKSTKWLYLRAKVVASDFVNICKNDGYNIDEAIVYESDCSKDILNSKVEDDAVLIFTSPSSIKCFLKNHTFKSTHKIIVIGKSSAKVLPKGVKYTISSKTTIDSCIEMVH
jgi:uroporphyrinogen-III synthase